MQIQNTPVHHLQLSSELKASGYSRPNAAELLKFEFFGPVMPIVAVRLLKSEKFEILANEQYWFAAQELGIHEVPVLEVFPENYTQRKSFLFDNQEEDPITRALRYEQWLSYDRNRTKTQLSTIEGCTRSNISHRIRLLILENPIQDLIREHRLSTAHGKELLKMKAGQGRVLIAEKAASQHWPVSRLKRHITGDQVGKIDDPKSDADAKKDPEVLRLESTLSGIVGSAVELDVDRGILQIDYRKNLDVLDGVLNRLGYTG